MFVEVVIYGGGLLIAGLGGMYVFTDSQERKHGAALKKAKGFYEEENYIEEVVVTKTENHTAEDELYRLAEIAKATSYFDYDKIKPPKKPSRTEKYWDRDSNDKIYKIECEIWELDYRQWKMRNDKNHPFDMTLVDFMEKRQMKINREHEIEMLIYKYSYAWDTYEQIIKEAREFNTYLSDEVVKEIHDSITQFIIDYCELEYRINKHQKQLKDEMDTATNESFMKRLQLERDYINKIRNKEEFDLSLEKL